MIEKRLSALLKKMIYLKLDPDVIAQLPERMNLTEYQFNYIVNDPRRGKIRHLRCLSEIINASPLDLVRQCKFGYNNITLKQAEQMARDLDSSQTLELVTTSA